MVAEAGISERRRDQPGHRGDPEQILHRAPPQSDAARGAGQFRRAKGGRTIMVATLDIADAPKRGGES
jgi:hypothetical protein